MISSTLPCHLSSALYAALQCVASWDCYDLEKSSWPQLQSLHCVKAVYSSASRFLPMESLELSPILSFLSLRRFSPRLCLSFLLSSIPSCSSLATHHRAWRCAFSCTCSSPSCTPPLPALLVSCQATELHVEMGLKEELEACGGVLTPTVCRFLSRSHGMSRFWRD